MSARDTSTTNYRLRFEEAPTVVARAPGRVNLIGEHTDYNDGFSLPMALPFETVVSVGRRSDKRARLVSEGYGAVEFELSDDPKTSSMWGRYVHGVAWALQQRGIEVDGFNAAIATDIPVGASLSSSAALEMAVTLALLTMSDASLDHLEMARLGQQVENEVVGVPSGLMDQLASVASKQGQALLIDFRSLDVRPVPIPISSNVVVMDTATRRELVDSEYADRRRACQIAAEALEVPALRDATISSLDAADLDPTIRRRAQHVVDENARTIGAAQSMAVNDPNRTGDLMNRSHASLRDLYEVSSPALDSLVEISQGQPGCFGARMTGGGFAGCAVALVETSQLDSFVEITRRAYDARTGRESRFWVVPPTEGASLL